MTAYFMVLNDGETFTSLRGCMIIAIDDDMWEDDNIQRAIGDNIAKPVVTFTDDIASIIVTFTTDDGEAFDKEWK